MADNINMLPYSYGFQQPYTFGSGTGNNTIIGGSGDTSIYNYGNNDYIYGGSGNSYIYNQGSNDYINGGSGNSTIINGPVQSPYASMPYAQQPYCQQPHQSHGCGQKSNDSSDNFMMALMMEVIESMINNKPKPIQTTTVTVSPAPIPPTPPAPQSVQVSGKIWGDPHFDLTGENGSSLSFTHTGTTGDSYDIFNGDNVNIDATYNSASNPSNPQVIGNLSISSGNSSISWNPSGTPSINGTAIAKGSTTTLSDGTVVNFDGTNLNITTQNADGTSGKITVVDNNKGHFDDINVSGNFDQSTLGGIFGTAYTESQNLTNDECNKFIVT